jgi:hypothetical protein
VVLPAPGRPMTRILRDMTDFTFGKLSHQKRKIARTAIGFVPGGRLRVTALMRQIAVPFTARSATRR